MKVYNIIAFLMALTLISGNSWARESIDLGGQWRFCLDSGDRGETEKWFTKTLDEKIHLPGSLQMQGFGNDPSVDTKWIGSIKDQSWFNSPEYEKFRQPGNVKIPCWLQPEKHYVGAAWYQRDIDIPTEWKDKHLELFLERCHWFTDVWIDDKYIGSGESLSVPHVFILPSDLSVGKHTLTIRVDNRIRFNVGHDSHSISDHTQTAWNGMIGELRLTARPRVWINSVKTYPGKAPNTLRIVAAIGNVTGKLAGTGRLQIGVVDTTGGRGFPLKTKKFTIESGATLCEVEYPIGANPNLWDEFNPDLYQLDLTLEAAIEGKNIRDKTSVSFGIRTVSSNGKRVTINGRPIFLRGTLECCIFPDTGYPPTNASAWRRIMQICRDHGLNHLRFHSWCPPDVAFQVADEFGFYLQVELPTWAYNMGKDKPRDDFLIRELDRVIDVYGNHPSFILMTMGNELRGNNDYLTGLVEQAKRTDSRRLYACTTHHDRSESDQFRITMRIGKKRTKIRGLRGPGTDWDFSDAIVDEKIPVIAHEIGQFCVWPDFNEISQYNGLLKAKNFELFRERLAQRGMFPQARDFLMSSGELQTICYKEEIESMLRTPDFGGFQLLDLHDFPGQGTSLVGVLNSFWNDSTKFPNGLKPLVFKMQQKNMHLGLWYAVDSSDDFANWTKDAERVLKIHRELGVNYFKFDAINFTNTIAERNCLSLLKKITEESNGKITIDLDVTGWDVSRPGYLGDSRVGPIFVENRYTDFKNYYPHRTLRNFWGLAQYIDPVRLRMEFLNNERRTEKYGNDPLAPASYNANYLFASVMFASPLAWMEVSELSEAYEKSVTPLIHLWRKHRQAIQSGTIIPIGSMPDGHSWTGFVSVDRAANTGYALIFREENDIAESSFELPLLKKWPQNLEVLYGNGHAKIKKNILTVNIPKAQDFVLVLLKCMSESIPAEVSASIYPKESVRKRPNILFCLADDQSYPHASAYGEPVIKTPVFDRIAQEGVLFTQAYCAAPSCTPSRSAILTGQDIWRLGQGRMLGPKWDVRNFGVGGTTLLKKGNNPYWNTGAFKEAIAFKTDVVIIKLGTNDTKAQNWKYKDEYLPNYKEMVATFLALDSHPRIWLCRPVPAFPARWGISDEVIVNDVLPRIDQLGKELNLPVIDLYTALSGKSELFPDKIHPNEQGAAIMTAEIYKALTGKTPISE